MDPPASKQVMVWQGLMERWKKNDRTAMEELFQLVAERLEALTRAMLRTFPGVKRWEQTDDVFQNALIRLLKATKKSAPASLSHFFSLTATEIRRELLDLKRHYFGPLGAGANLTTNAGQDSQETPRYETAKRSQSFDGVDYHEYVDRLPEKEREIVSLLIYFGCSQVEAAEILEVTPRTVKNRYDAALYRLRIAMLAKGRQKSS